jgi:hypothetical protein
MLMCFSSEGLKGHVVDEQFDGLFDFMVEVHRTRPCDRGGSQDSGKHVLRLRNVGRLRAFYGLGEAMADLTAGLVRRQKRRQYV